MSPFRRILMVAGLLILAVSLALLVLALLPGQREGESDPIPQPDLTLPTPGAVFYLLPHIGPNTAMEMWV